MCLKKLTKINKITILDQSAKIFLEHLLCDINTKVE